MKDKTFARGIESTISTTMSCFGSFEDLLITLGFKPGEMEIDQEEGLTKKKKKGLFRRSDRKRRGMRGSKRSKRSRALKFRKSKSDATLCSEGSDFFLEDKIELGHRFPGSTQGERTRFLKQRSLTRATEKMDYYMKWRQQYHLDSGWFRRHTLFSSDEAAWNFAVEHSAKYYNGGTVQSTLPRIVKFAHTKNLRAKDGKRIAQVLPGMIDKRLAPLEFYALCVAVYLDLKFDRNSDESIYVLVDVRAGLNWPNASPTALMVFVKSLTKNLADCMPERMQKTFVYPIPVVAKPIWGIYKAFLDPKIVKKISVAWGPASANSPIPGQMKNDIFDDKIIEEIEDSRFAEFKYV